MPRIKVSRHGQPQKYVFRRHHPARAWWIALAGVLVLTGGGWLVYRFGLVLHSQDYAEAAMAVERLRQRNERLEAWNRELREQATSLERKTEVARETAEALRRRLKDLEADKMELQEELAFYRSIVSPSAMESGLHVQALRLEPRGAARSYRYELVLTLVRGNGSSAEGNVDLQVRGRQGSDILRLPVEDLAAEPRELTFSFRYFQRLRGRLRLPEGFEPREVIVRVEPTGALEPVRRRFAWESVLGSEGDVG